MRKELGLSQTELGERLGITQGAVGKLERGENKPSSLLLVALRYVLGYELTPEGRLRRRSPSSEVREGSAAPYRINDDLQGDPEWQRALELLVTIFRAGDQSLRDGILLNLEAIAAYAQTGNAERRARPPGGKADAG